MSEYPPESFELADRIRDMKVEEVRHEVQGYRLQRQARGGRPGSVRLYSAALAAMGQRLARVGARLQERYGADISTPAAAGAGSPTHAPGIK